jgi:hypothetical protein
MARLEDVSRSAGIANDYYHCFRDYLVATPVQAPNRTRKNALSVISGWWSEESLFDLSVSPHFSVLWALYFFKK